MDLSKLQHAPGATKNRKRVGRGGAHGKTSCRGQNGQKSRAGAKFRLWFEGGQMPIQRRLPKRGFFSFTKVQFQIVNLGELDALKTGEEITPAVLANKGLIKNIEKPVKILGNGVVTGKISVSANAFSKSAKEKIEAAGGRATIL